jgi:hypothetical protein
MISLVIHDSWEQLNGATRQWLIDNPGCVNLPRTIVAAILRADQTVSSGRVAFPAPDCVRGSLANTEMRGTG